MGFCLLITCLHLNVGALKKNWLNIKNKLVLNKSLKIIFSGTPQFAVPTLQALLDSEHEVVAVYTQPDRRKGRGQQVSASPVKLLAETKGLPVVQPASLRDEAVQAALATWQADVVVVAYGLILPEALALPRWLYQCAWIAIATLAGAAPIQRAIEAGDDLTGVTIMQMDKGLDTGAMLKTVTCPLTHK